MALAPWLALGCALATVAAPAARATAAPAENCAQAPQDQATSWAQRMFGLTARGC